jgi:transcriptional regulator of acetoin/glycerol metabolism
MIDAANAALRNDSRGMTITTTVETDRKAVLEAASALFDSIGEVLLCVDGEFRIQFAPDDLRDIFGAPVAAVLGHEVETLLRQGRRAETRALFRTPRATRGVTAILAPYVSRREGDSTKYVIVLRSLDEPDSARSRIVAALEANRWRRDAAARALGISRATLWRKMRDLGLL